MKKQILLLALAATCLTASAQTKPDTTKQVPFHQSEMMAIFNQMQNIENHIHKLDIPALKWDTLDNLLFGIQQVYG